MSAATKVDRADLARCSVEGIGRMGHMVRTVALHWAISSGSREDAVEPFLRRNIRLWSTCVAIGCRSDRTLREFAGSGDTKPMAFGEPIECRPTGSRGGR
jgi:hypothetical protein